MLKRSLRQPKSTITVEMFRKTRLRQSEGTDLQPCKAVPLLKILSVTITDEASRNDERKETG